MTCMVDIIGREVRLGTASLQSYGTGSNSLLVDVGKLNIKKYAAKQGLAMALLDYLLYVEHNNRKALELCAEATQVNQFGDWFWKARLGKCYYKLGKGAVILMYGCFDKSGWWFSICFMYLYHIFIPPL